MLSMLMLHNFIICTSGVTYFFYRLSVHLSTIEPRISTDAESTQ